MQYKNSEMKIDQLVSYLNGNKINLSPAFQRGHIWKPPMRKQLLKNIVNGKPIPAIFLYKEASGSKYSYNILDGKQRLESIIMFIGSRRKDVQVSSWQGYFFDKQLKSQAEFAIEYDGSKKTFKDLSDDVVRDFCEYTIPTIEITLDETTSLNEIITLFVDINQQGEVVKRFDIVKALCKNDPLLQSVFDLMAQDQKRKQDVFLKMINNDITYVLKQLLIVQRLPIGNAKTDKVWELLLELSLFVRNKKHRKSVETLKEFIRADKKPAPSLEALNKKECDQIRKGFALMKKLNVALGTPKVFQDYTHFYTLFTSVVKYRWLQMPFPDIQRKLGIFVNRLSGGVPFVDPVNETKFKKYLDLSSKQTTDAARRSDREKEFKEIIDSL